MRKPPSAAYAAFSPPLYYADKPGEGKCTHCFIGTFAAAVTASRRAPEIKDAVILSFYAIAAGSSVVIATLLATGTLDTV